MGYYEYQRGIIYRHLNQEGGWDSHLDRCRRFIINAVDHFRPENITVLGSGWLLDLPVAEMSEKAKRITLVDIVQPPEVVKQFAGFSNVEIVEADVTGGLIDDVWNFTRRRFPFTHQRSLESLHIPEFKIDVDQDMIISLNILTQLEVLPARLITKRAKVPDEQLAAFRIAVQQKHIDFLRKHTSVLITDTAEYFTGTSGATEITRTALADMPEGRYREEWTWNFDLVRSDFNEKRSVLRVLALIL
jgi:hypothetical protein